LQHVFERVENWFRLSKGSISAPFYLDDAVYLSIASIRYLDPAFVVGVEIDRPDSYRFEGKHLVGVFYILQNALENIVKHAKGEGATGSVRVSGESTQIILRVQNKIDDSCLAETRQHVADAIAHLAVTGSGSLVGREGRSGLHKVRAILEEFGTEESLALVVLDGCIVEFSCRLPFRVNETSEFEVWPPLKH
jgi:LytS/YehU family sensor histidine kinase